MNTGNETQKKTEQNHNQSSRWADQAQSPTHHLVPAGFSEHPDI